MFDYVWYINIATNSTKDKTRTKMKTANENTKFSETNPFIENNPCGYNKIGI